MTNSRIDGPSIINNNVKINLTGIKNNSNVSVNSTFGDGFAADNSMALVSTDSRFSALMSQFNFEPPIYPKGGFAQFSPTDSDYEAMKYLDTLLDKPEMAYSEA